jgi:hypothetical protein
MLPMEVMKMGYASIQIVISSIKIWNGSTLGLIFMMGSIGMVMIYLQNPFKEY